jgi:hypothetical protein
LLKASRCLLKEKGNHYVRLQKTVTATDAGLAAFLGGREAPSIADPTLR